MLKTFCTSNLIDSMPARTDNKRLVNDSSAYYKGLIGMILCILLGAHIGLVLIKVSLDQAQDALTAYQQAPQECQQRSYELLLQAKDGDFFISHWLRNRNTVEYLGTWESVYNPNFNYGEFATIRSQAAWNKYRAAESKILYGVLENPTYTEKHGYGREMAIKEVQWMYQLVRERLIHLMEYWKQNFE